MIDYQARCDSILIALVGNEHMIQMWWNNQNKAFKMLTPAEVMITEPKVVYNYLIQLGAGQFL